MRRERELPASRHGKEVIPPYSATRRRLQMGHNNNAESERGNAMNKFVGIGTLPRNGSLNGSEKKVLRFTLATRVGFNKKTKKDMWSYVPCVVFNPSEKTVHALTENTRGILLCLEGRVNTSKFETKTGETKYSTEVVVDQGSIQLLQVAIGAETAESDQA
jgi:single-stranded DNA-binding protein